MTKALLFVCLLALVGCEPKIGPPPVVRKPILLCTFNGAESYRSAPASRIYPVDAWSAGALWTMRHHDGTVLATYSARPGEACELRTVVVSRP